MQPSSPSPAVTAEHSAVFALLEFPESRPVLNMQRVSSLLTGLLRGFGHSVERTSQSAARTSRIETSDFVLSFGMVENRLHLKLSPTPETEDRVGHATEALLARLVRALCAAFEPSRIFWNETETGRDTVEWRSAFRPVLSRGLTPPARPDQTRPDKTTAVAIWPNRPHDFVPPQRITTSPWRSSEISLPDR